MVGTNNGLLCHLADGSAAFAVTIQGPNQMADSGCFLAVLVVRAEAMHVRHRLAALWAAVWGQQAGGPSWRLTQYHQRPNISPINILSGKTAHIHQSGGNSMPTNQLRVINSWSFLFHLRTSNFPPLNYFGASPEHSTILSPNINLQNYQTGKNLLFYFSDNPIWE